MSAVFEINPDTRYRVIALSDGQTEIAVTFPFQANDDVKAELIDADGISTLMVEADDYTLEGAGQSAGGTLTLIEPSESGQSVLVYGQVLLERLSSIVRGGKYDSKATDADLDRTTIALQEVRRDMGRALKTPLGSTGGVVRPGSSGMLARWGIDGGLVDGGLGDGEQGPSAYEVAVANGFVGSEAAWLATLQGEPGPPGADGAPGSGRTTLTANATYHCIDYPSPDGVGGDTGTGTALDPFVGPQYALEWIKANVDSAGFNVRLEIDSDIATENSPDGYHGLYIGVTPLFGGGQLTVAWMGHKTTCATSGNGVVNDSYDFVQLEGPDFDGADDDVYFDHIVSAGITFVSDPKHGKAGFGDQQRVLSNSDLRVSGTDESYGNADKHGAAVTGGVYINTAECVFTGSVEFATAFISGADSAVVDMIGSAYTGTFTGVKYRGTTGTTITSPEEIPGSEDGVLDATSSYNGDFGGGGGGAVDSVNGQTGIVVLDAGDIGVTPAGSIASTDVQAALAELDSEKQAQHANLSAEAGLTGAANKISYYTGAGAKALADFPASARTMLTAGLSADVLAMLDDANFAAIRATLSLTPGTDVQAFDAELAAIAGLTSAANKIPYFTGSGAAALADFPAAARTAFTAGFSADVLSLLDDANFAAMRTSLSLTPGTDVQAYDAELAAIAGLTSAANKIPYFTGSGAAALADFPAAARTAFTAGFSANVLSLLDDANFAAMRTTLSLTPGTDVQAYDAELAAIAGLTSAADKIPYFTGSGTAGLADFPASARTAFTAGFSANVLSLLDDANFAAMRTTLSLTPGTDVQAFDADLSTIAGLTATTDNFIVSVASAWASRTPAQVRTTLGLGSAALVNTGTSGGTVPLLNAANTFSAQQSFTTTAVDLAIGQLAFPATQNASAGANVFDDYEEGTWTPSILFNSAAVGMTYGTRTGTYTKAARIVNLDNVATLSAKGSSTGSAGLASLPFTSAAQAAFAWRMDAITPGSGSVPDMRLQSGATVCDIRALAQASGNEGTLTDTAFSNTSTLTIAGPYTTAT